MSVRQHLDPEYLRARDRADRLAAVAEQSGSAADRKAAQNAHADAAVLAHQRLTGPARDRALRAHERGMTPRASRAATTPQPMGSALADQGAPTDQEYLKAHHLARRMSAIADQTGDRHDHEEARHAHAAARDIARKNLTGEQRARAERRHTEAHDEHQAGSRQNMAAGDQPAASGASTHAVKVHTPSGTQSVTVQGPGPGKPAKSYEDHAIAADQQTRRAAILRGIAARKGDGASIAAADRAEARAVKLHEAAAAAATTPAARESHQRVLAAMGRGGAAATGVSTATPTHSVVLRGASGERRVTVQGPAPLETESREYDKAARAARIATATANAVGTPEAHDEAAQAHDEARKAARRHLTGELRDRAVAQHSAATDTHDAAVFTTADARDDRLGIVPRKAGESAAERAAHEAHFEAVTRAKPGALGTGALPHPDKIARAERLHAGLDQDSSYAKRSRAVKALREMEDAHRAAGDVKGAERFKSMREDYAETRRARRAGGLVAKKVAPPPGAHHEAPEVERPKTGMGSKSKGKIVQGKKGGKYILLPSGHKRYIK